MPMGIRSGSSQPMTRILSTACCFTSATRRSMYSTYWCFLTRLMMPCDDGVLPQVHRQKENTQQLNRVPLNSLSGHPWNQKRPPERAAEREGVKHGAYLRTGGHHRARLCGAAIR